MSQEILIFYIPFTSPKMIYIHKKSCNHLLSILFYNFYWNLKSKKDLNHRLTIFCPFYYDSILIESKILSGIIGFNGGSYAVSCLSNWPNAHCSSNSWNVSSVFCKAAFVIILACSVGNWFLALSFQLKFQPNLDDNRYLLVLTGPGFHLM